MATMKTISEQFKESTEFYKALGNTKDQAIRKGAEAINKKFDIDLLEHCPEPRKSEILNS